MSLSFVASTVQTATADGGYEEKEINKEQAEQINQRNAHKPLFEQLRQKQEEEQMKQEELQREIMRGTCALNDEDAAHLDALEKQRRERERVIQQRTQEELMLFRAARAERQQKDLHDGSDGDKSTGDTRDLPKGSSTLSVVAKKPSAAPKLVVKKRKRRVNSSKNNDGAKEGTREVKKQVRDIDEVPKAKSAGLGSLLSGYGSSDEESDS